MVPSFQLPIFPGLFARTKWRAVNLQKMTTVAGHDRVPMITAAKNGSAPEFISLRCLPA